MFITVIFHNMDGDSRRVEAHKSKLKQDIFVRDLMVKEWNSMKLEGSPPANNAKLYEALQDYDTDLFIDRFKTDGEGPGERLSYEFEN